MRIACWITKAAGRHLEYVILTNLPQQQWLCERISMFVCMYICVLLPIIYFLLNYPIKESFRNILQNFQEVFEERAIHYHAFVLICKY